MVPGAVAGFFSGIIGGYILECLRRFYFVPELSFVWEEGKKGFTPTAQVRGPLTEKSGQEVQARYVRVAIRNDSETKTSAKACRAYLTDIKLVTNGTTVETGFAETLRLRWAYEGPNGELHAGIDIPRDVTVFFDVFSSQEPSSWMDDHDPGQRILEFAAKDAREAPELLRILGFNATYRFSLMVTAEGVDPKRSELDVRIGGQWDDVEILDLNTEPRIRPGNS